MTQSSCAPKIPITKAHELPRFTYRLAGSVGDLIESAEAFDAFAECIRRDLDSLLVSYDIVDAATVRKIQTTLLALDLLAGRYDAARARVDVVSSLYDKPAQRLTKGLLQRAIAESGGVAATSASADAARVARRLAAILSGLPWEIVGEDIKQLTGTLALVDAKVITGVVRDEFEAAAQRGGVITDDVAYLLVNMRQTLALMLPIRDAVVPVLRAFIDAHDVVPPNIWIERAGELPVDCALSPVAIGVWDSGVDASLFDGRVIAVDGGVGVAYDANGERSRDLLHPMPPGSEEEYGELLALLKGYCDTQSCLETPDACALRQAIARVPADDVVRFLETLNLTGTYVHGTHVAGIALDGNPAARLLIARMTWDHRMAQPTMTRDAVLAQAAAYRDIVAAYRRHSVRVVNMSWHRSMHLYDDGARIVRELFELDRSALYDAISGAPEILFVAAAGNFNTGAEFHEFIPASFTLPNVITVGAVDQAGRETSFTASGPTVAIYANGAHVTSIVPGGRRLSLSGTSVAAPAVTNLAGKLLAIDPSLTPEQVVELLLAGADTRAGTTLRLLNPKRTLELQASRRSAIQSRFRSPD